MGFRSFTEIHLVTAPSTRPAQSLILLHVKVSSVMKPVVVGDSNSDERNDPAHRQQINAHKALLSCLTHSFFFSISFSLNKSSMRGVTATRLLPGSVVFSRPFMIAFASVLSGTHGKELSV